MERKPEVGKNEDWSDSKEHTWYGGEKTELSSELQVFPEKKVKQFEEVIAKTLTTEKLLTWKRKGKKFESLGQNTLLWEKTLGFFYWNIVHLQCCVNFCYTAKWLFYQYICVYIYICVGVCVLFCTLFHYGLSRAIEYSSMLYSRPRLFIHSIHANLHLLTPHPSLLTTTGLFSVSLSLFLFRR